MLLYQTNPVGVQFFSYVNTFFCSNKFTELLAAWVKRYCTKNGSRCQSFKKADSKWLEKYLDNDVRGSEISLYSIQFVSCVLNKAGDMKKDEDESRDESKEARDTPVFPI